MSAELANLARVRAALVDGSIYDQPSATFSQGMLAIIDIAAAAIRAGQTRDRTIELERAIIDRQEVELERLRRQAERAHEAMRDWSERNGIKPPAPH
jgi:hypothetical protein